VLLSRDQEHFISRAPKPLLIDSHFETIGRVSSHSWKVRSMGHVEEDIRRARVLGPAYPAYVMSETGAPLNVTDRIFVRFKPGVVPAEFAKAHHLGVVRRLSDRDYLLRADPSADVVDVVRSLTEDERATLESVDHDLNVQFRHQGVQAGDPLAERQWYLFADTTDPLVHKRALVDCVGAWEVTGGYGNGDVVISVIDSGCDLTEPDFAPGKFVAWALLRDGELRDGELCTSREIRKGTANMKGDLHGTLAATLAAASRNCFGGIGAAPACRLLPVKVEQMPGFDHSPQSLLVDIIQYLSDKADIVTNSWSIGPCAFWPPPVCEALARATTQGGPNGNGMVWVWAAGNSNCPIQLHTTIDVPTKVTPQGDVLVVEESARNFVNSFVGIPGVIHVGAISSLGQRCHYSNYGPGLDLVAPSNNMHLYDRQLVLGKEMVAPLRLDGLHQFGGTSAAAPLVAGIAALVRSVNPQLTSPQIVSVLKRTADKEFDMSGYEPCSRPTDPLPNWDVSPVPPYHHGDFSEIYEDGTWSPWFGFGKVNARRAVEEAIRLRSYRV
jgi:subtilisin family serine protease